MSKKRRNPVANSAILRKGGVHQKSRTAERQKAKRTLAKSIAACTATERGHAGSFEWQWSVHFIKFVFMQHFYTHAGSRFTA